MPLSHLLLCLSIVATLMPARAPWPWLSLLIMAVTVGQVHGQLGVVAMVPVAAMAALAWMTIEARHRPRREAVLMGLMLVVGTALALHVLPGFLNPTYLLAASDTRPATLKYLNFDKGVAGMLMLAVLASQQRRRSEGVALAPAPGLPAFTLLAVAAATLALPWGLAVVGGLGQPALRWPENAGLYLGANLFFTCVAEEAAFRGVIQGLLARRFGTDPRTAAGWVPVLVAAVLFGLAHAAGGPLYVGAAMLAGVGYGLAYALTARIEVAILLHFALNALVLLTLNVGIG